MPLDYANGHQPKAHTPGYDERHIEVAVAGKVIAHYQAEACPHQQGSKPKVVLGLPKHYQDAQQNPNIKDGVKHHFPS